MPASLATVHREHYFFTHNNMDNIEEQRVDESDREVEGAIRVVVVQADTPADLGAGAPYDASVRPDVVI